MAGQWSEQNNALELNTESKKIEWASKETDQISDQEVADAMKTEKPNELERQKMVDNLQNMKPRDLMKLWRELWIKAPEQDDHLIIVKLIMNIKQYILTDRLDSTLSDSLTSNSAYIKKMQKLIDTERNPDTLLERAINILEDAKSINDKQWQLRIDQQIKNLNTDYTNTRKAMQEDREMYVRNGIISQANQDPILMAYINNKTENPIMLATPPLWKPEDFKDK